MGRLTDAEKATLREMESYRAGVYYFRQATCKRLVEKGLAEPTRDDVKRPPHRLTPAGRAALREQTP